MLGRVLPRSVLGWGVNSISWISSVALANCLVVVATISFSSVKAAVGTLVCFLLNSIYLKCREARYICTFGALKTFLAIHSVLREIPCLEVLKNFESRKS